MIGTNVSVRLRLPISVKPILGFKEVGAKKNNIEYPRFVIS